MPANGRNPFTDDDDALLVKYLAKYNPGVKGRSGNRIYKILCDNEQNKWSWSSRHPWGGWRDRYTKNQEEFNERIIKYQIKKGLPTENPMWINGTQKLKGSDAEGDEGVEEGPKLKRKRSSSDGARKRVKRSSNNDHEGDLAKGPSSAEPETVDNEDNSETDPESNPSPPVSARPRRTHVPDIYPDIAVLDEPSLRDNNNTHPKPPSTRPPRKVKPTLLHNPDSDFFASVPPTPTTTTSRPPTTASGSRASVTSNTSVHEPQLQPSTSKSKTSSRGLPKLVEGTFRSFFAGVRQWTSGDARSSDDESPRKEKEWPPVRARKVLSKKAGDDMEVEEQTENPRDRRTDGESVNDPSEHSAGEDVEVVELQSMTSPRDTEKGKRPSVTQPTPARISARCPPQHVNAVASSSRVQLTPRPPQSSSHRAPATEPQIQLQQNETPRHEQSPRRKSSLQHPGSHHSRRTQRSPSPLDWGSPVGPEQNGKDNASANASSPVIATSSPLKTQQVLIPQPRRPSPLSSRNDRRGLPGSVHDARSSTREDSTSRAPPLPRLSFTDINGSNSTRGGSLRNRNRNPSIGSGSVDPGSSLPRRSRAEASTDGHAPQYQYHLASPPPPLRAVVSSRRQTDEETPLERKAKRRAQGQLPFGFKPTTLTQQNGTRRHSFPAASSLPRIDFNRMHGSTRPRQSLPPRAPSHHHDREPLPRRRSLFSPRTPAVVSSASTSASGSPMQLSISADDRILFEQLGLQALMVIAKNHGFGLEVVRNVYARTGDLRKTDEVLLRMRRKAEAEGEAALLGADEGSPELKLREEEPPYRRRHAGVTATRSPPEPEPPEEPFELQHRRQHSGASATTTTTRSPSSSQRKKQQRHQHQADEFCPQPLARDVLAETEYSPPSGSRAGAITRLKKKGRLEEGMQREQQRVSGGGTLSAFSRHVRIQQGRPDMDEDNAHAVHSKRTAAPQFAAFAEGDVQVLRELERRDVSLAMLRTADVARYMIDGTVPAPYR